MKQYKIKYLDINGVVIKSNIVKANNKYAAEQKAANDVQTVNGQTLPVNYMPNDTFFITATLMN